MNASRNTKVDLVIRIVVRTRTPCLPPDKAACQLNFLQQLDDGIYITAPGSEFGGHVTAPDGQQSLFWPLELGGNRK